ncbi:nitrate assimilation regulatory protein nirA [Purpureocillium lavendulum]|uniref:Nitrate assimilation regulatory protein nirA n=1 Tax=Purpureocillium lavendulum TaxID=1247861 RepID=A0AB34FBS8_9HYPO|nr:nitrate assimilation regulatory protein nirA [Purpureocillium lavendulum]
MRLLCETGLDCAFDHVQLGSKDDMRTEIGRHPIRDGLPDHMEVSGASSADVRSATCQDYRGALSGPSSATDKDEFAGTTSERNLWAGTQSEANFPVTRGSALGSVSLPPPSPGRGKEQRVDPWTRTGWAVAMIREQLHSLLMADYLPFCLLCEDVFLKDLATGEGRYCSPALVNSLLALASRTWNEHQHPHPNQRQQEQPNYHDVSDVGSPPSGWWYSQALFDEAEALISDKSPPDTLPDIQTLGMLALYHVSCGRDAEAYELAGSFAAAIAELCLREPLAEDEQDEQYAQVRATTYCGAQSLVRYDKQDLSWGRFAE